MCFAAYGIVVSERAHVKAISDAEGELAISDELSLDISPQTW